MMSIVDTAVVVDSSTNGQDHHTLRYQIHGSRPTMSLLWTFTAMIMVSKVIMALFEQL